MAFTGIAALIAGEAVTAVVVLSAVAEVGMVLSVVGAVTGNEDLMKIGGIMGLVGGIGGLVAGGMGAGASAAAGSLTEAGTSAALDAASAEAMGAFGGELAADAATQSVVSGMESAASEGIIGAAAQPAASTAMHGAAAPIADATAAAPLQGVQSAAPTVNDVAGIQAPAGAQGPIGAQAPTTPWEADFTNTTALSSPNAGVEAGLVNSDNFFSKFSTFAKNNKDLLNTGTQLFGGYMKGQAEEEMWNQKMALERDRMARANSVGSFAPTTRGIIGSRA